MKRKNLKKRIAFLEELLADDGIDPNPLPASEYFPFFEYKKKDTQYDSEELLAMIKLSSTRIENILKRLHTLEHEEAPDLSPVDDRIGTAEATIQKIQHWAFSIDDKMLGIRREINRLSAERSCNCGKLEDDAQDLARQVHRLRNRVGAIEEQDRDRWSAGMMQGIWISEMVERYHDESE